MKVKLSYSLDMSEVKQKLSDLMKESSRCLEAQSRLMQQIGELLPLDQINELAALSVMDSVRRNLAEIDQNIVECTAILYGYNEAAKGNAAPTPAEQQQQMMQSTAPPKSEN